MPSSLSIPASNDDVECKSPLNDTQILEDYKLVRPFIYVNCDTCSA